MTYKSMKLIHILREVVGTDNYIAYHGSDDEITKFVDNFVGGVKAVDGEGSGIYFADRLEDAMLFGNIIYKVELDGRFIDRSNPKSNVDREELIQLIKMRSDWEMDAMDWAEDPDVGAEVAVNAAIEYNGDEGEVFQQIEADFYRHYPLKWVRNMTKLGYDGLVSKPKAHGGVHIIVYNPSIIKFLERVNDI